MKYMLVAMLAIVRPAFAENLPVNAAVTQETIGDTICVPAWTKMQRPSACYTSRLKVELIRREGLPEELLVPIPAMSHDELREFESVPQTVWPEVGSRMMTRVMTGQDLEGAWVIVQDGSYRFAVTQADGGLLVRSIIYEYLATEVRWS